MRRGNDKEKQRQLYAVARSRCEAHRHNRGDDGVKQQRMRHAAMAPQVAVAYAQAETNYVNIGQNRAQDRDIPEAPIPSLVSLSGLTQRSSYQCVREDCRQKKLGETDIKFTQLPTYPGIQFLTASSSSSATTVSTVSSSSFMNAKTSCGTLDIQTGANDSRCSGVGPYSRSAARCLGER